MIRLDEIDIEILENLQQRLVADYNGDGEFEQFEEDRIEISKAIGYLKLQASNVKTRLYEKYQAFAYLDGFACLVYILENFGIDDNLMHVYDKVGEHFGKNAGAIERVIRFFRVTAGTEEEKKMTNKAFITKNIIEFSN
jgi:hypothetical protein